MAGIIQNYNFIYLDLNQVKHQYISNRNYTSGDRTVLGSSSPFLILINAQISSLKVFDFLSIHTTLLSKQHDPAFIS